MEPFHKWMRRRNLGHRSDFGYIQDTQIGLPSVKARNRIMVGTETFRHGRLALDSMIEFDKVPVH
jgi:hypothetical protein